MEFFDTHWAKFLFGGMFLWLVFQYGKINTARDEAELAVAGLVGEENWSSFQEISIRRQISIDTALERIGIGLAIIVVLLMILTIKQII